MLVSDHCGHDADTSASLWWFDAKHQTAVTPLRLTTDHTTSARNTDEMSRSMEDLIGKNNPLYIEGPPICLDLTTVATSTYLLEIDCVYVTGTQTESFTSLKRLSKH